MRDPTSLTMVVMLSDGKPMAWSSVPSASPTSSPSWARAPERLEAAITILPVQRNEEIQIRGERPHGGVNDFMPRHIAATPRRVIGPPMPAPTFGQDTTGAPAQ